MFKKSRKFRRYGEAYGKTGRTGLLGKVYDFNDRGDIIPESSTDGSFTWSFGSWSFGSQDNNIAKTK